MDTQDLPDQAAGWQSSTQSTVQTFKAFYATLSAQGEAIKALERSRDELAFSLRTDIKAASQSKANAVETSARIAEVEVQLKAKADVSDMERRSLKIDTDANLKMQMAEVLSLLTHKTNETDVRAWKNSQEQSMAALHSEVARLAAGLEEAKAALSCKAGAADTAVALASKADLGTMEAQLCRKVDEATLADALAMKADVPALSALETDIHKKLAVVQAALHLKAETARMHESLRSLELRAEKGNQTTAEGLSSMSTALNQALKALMVETREELDDMGSALRDELYSAVADVTEQQAVGLMGVSEQMECKPNMEQVQWLLDKHTSEVTTKITAEVAELRAQVDIAKQLAAKVDALQQGLAAQAHAETVLRAALEAKANIEDVNKALAEVCLELESRRASGGCASASGVPVLSDTGGPLIGRWLWKTGVTLVGGVLPWNVQAVNTHPDILEWGPDSSVIVCHLPGLWQLSFGLFARKMPEVQVYVNGEPVISSQRSYKSTPLKDFPSSMASESKKASNRQLVNQHSSGNVTGLTGSEFLSLPVGGARLAVTVGGVDSSGERIEGFLQLQKL